MKNQLLRLLRNAIKRAYQIMQILGSIIRIFLYSKSIKNEKIIDNTELYVLGNGPSLNKLLADNLRYLSTQATLVVNDFFLHPDFQSLRPKIYVIADSVYWDDYIPQKFQPTQKQFVENLLLKVNWLMYLFVPVHIYKIGYFQKKFFSNPNIRIKPFNQTSFEGPKWMRYYFYDKQLAKPLSGNVMGSALFISLHTGIKKILLFGVEHSWSRNLYVNSQNQTCIKTEHFYKTGEGDVWLKSNGDPYSIQRAFLDISVMLGGYKEINQYAKYKQINIYNCTNDSFIDAFDRKVWQLD